MVVLRLCLCLSLAIVAINALPITKERLRFKLSAKGLPDKDDIGTIDPYVEVFYTEGGNTREVKLGQTDAISDNENPEWGKIFEFDFDRNKNQKWHFKVWDKDNLREDDKGGQVWVDVNDYVDKGQLINANLDKQGVSLECHLGINDVVQPNRYLSVKSADVQIQQRTTGTPGTLPYAPGSPDTGILTFRVGASGLKDKDNFGKSDPYAEVFYTNGLTGKQIKVGRTTTLSNTKNPQWGETFTLNWDRKKEQRLYFKIADNDNFREDDTLGKAWLEVNDYVAKGQVMTVHLNKQGTLTLTRADGLPPNPYNPALVQNQPQPFPGHQQQLPGQQFPGQPGQQFPGQQFPGQQVHGQQFPGQQVSGQQFPGQQVPGQQFPGQQVPGQQFPGQQFPNAPAQPLRGNVPVPPPLPPQPAHKPFHPTNQDFQQPIAPTPNVRYPIKLRFKLSGSNFPDKDIIGTSDPYVKVFISQDGLPETLLKKGTKLSDNENPQWDDIFEFNFDPAKHPKLRFLILDEDDNARDDEIGNVSMDAADLEIRNYAILRLPVGSLTVTKI